MTLSIKRTVLIVLDGFGERAERDANAIRLARTPAFDALYGEFPHTLINTSGGAINYARATGTGAVAVQPMVANQTASFQIKGSNTYTIQVHLIGTDVLVHGVVRQDGAGSPSASCVNYGQAVRLG